MALNNSNSTLIVFTDGSQHTGPDAQTHTDVGYIIFYKRTELRSGTLRLGPQASTYDTEMVALARSAAAADELISTL